MSASERVVTLAATVANAVRREFPAVPRDDLYSEAVLWSLSNPAKLAEYESNDDQRQGDRLIFAAMRNRLRWYAQTETARSYGYDHRSQQFAHYSLAQIEEDLLPAVFDPEAWASPPKNDDGIRHKTDPSHGGTWLAMLADVADAYRRLPDRDQKLVELRYRQRLGQREIAGLLGISVASVSEALGRAVERIHRLLGGEAPVYVQDEIPVGSRRAISNSRAQAMTRSAYDGE